MGRPRVSRISYNVKLYTPPKSKTWMDDAAFLIKNTYKGEILAGPIKIKSVFIHKRPRKLSRKKDPTERIHKTTKPDIDNLEKILFDALVYAEVMKDDSQIVHTISADYYCAKNEPPHVEFTLYHHENIPIQKQQNQNPGPD